MRYLVTGGLGVIGSLISRRLLAAGHEVTIIDACEEPRNEWVANRYFQDACKIERIRLEGHYRYCVPSLVEDADRVIHCAAHTGIPHSVVDPSDDWASNVDATRELLDAVRQHPRPTVILSSIKPYRVPVGSAMPEEGLDEETPLEPDEPYAASKAAQSMLAMAYARSYDLPLVTFRCSNLYGPAPCHGPRHGWATWFAISAALGRAIEVQGTGRQSRDLLHADDVYEACVAALGHLTAPRPYDMGVIGRTFNLGGGRANLVTVGGVAARLQEQTGVEVVSGPPRAMDDERVFVNCAAFTRATGWRPRVSAEAGIDGVLSWAREHRDELARVYEGV